MKELNLQLEDFLKDRDLSQTHLVLDSTGPSLTKHYIALDAIGDERLSQFKKIHTFSGGTFAYFGYKAARRNQCRHPMSEYYKNLDRTMRSFHSVKFPLFQQLIRYYRKNSLYQSLAPMEEVIRYVFPEDLLGQKCSQIDPSFTAYYGAGKDLVELSGEHRPKGIDTIFDIIRFSINIPFMYGTESSYHDPAFHRGYRKKLREIAHGKESALIVTPWRSGTKGNTLFLNPFQPANQKFVMGRDIFCLLANLPNPSYGKDLKAIFG